MTSAREPLTVAAVDLGSNSFHLVIGRFVDNELQIVDRMREQVTLADGLDDRDCLTEEAQQRALSCLERVGQRLRSVPSVRVRAVGTNTLRRAKDADAFRVRAQAALGHPIEIVSGQEEARLIFLGVAQGMYSSATRLLVDIGGGSTEIILGEGYRLLQSHSLFMGCVRYSRKFFPGGTLRKERFRDAEIAAALELRGISRGLTRLGWEACVGSSGTIAAVQEILRVNGWSDGPIRRAGLKKLRRSMIDTGSIERLSISGLKQERARVLPGGLAILRAIFRSLEIESMTATTGALREGVLHDLVGRIRRDDIRDHTIGRMVERYQVDLGQAIRVEQVALRLLSLARDPGEMEPQQSRKLLVWASRLHEIGLAVSHTGFHKHGAYLIEHSPMPGFSEGDRAMLAAIVRGQRRKISSSLFAHLAAEVSRSVLHLCVLFRLAVLLNRGRGPQATPAVAVAEDWSGLELRFPVGWAATHPLTLADCRQEAGFLRTLGIDLVVREDDPGEQADPARPTAERGAR